MRYYVDPDGAYAGAWWNGEPPASSGLTEVPSPPDHISQVWDGTTWEDTEATKEWRLSVINAAVKVYLDGVALGF